MISPDDRLDHLARMNANDLTPAQFAEVAAWYKAHRVPRYRRVESVRAYIGRMRA